MRSTWQPHLEFVWYRARTELQSEASRAYIGILWWLFEPLLYLATFYFVFAVGFRAGGPDFVPFLLVGLVNWKWFGSSVQGATNALPNNHRLLQQVYLPKHLLVATVLVANTLKYAIIFTLLLGFLYFMGYLPSLAWGALPVLMLLQLALMFGFAALGAASVPFLPDLKLVIDSGIMVMFFTSGIFYDIRDRSEEAQAYLYLNPMARLIDAYRDVLLHQRLPEFETLSYVLGLALATTLAGMYLLRRYDRVYPKIVF